MDYKEFLLRLLAATVLGSVIGLERQLGGRSVGIRTCVLVCIGSSLFIAFPICIPDGNVSRSAAQIVSGVGFLGSGIIFKDGSNIRGLNTAATIWCTAGIGMFTGAGLYLLAMVAALCLFAVNLLLRFLSGRHSFWRHYEGIGHLCALRLSVSVQDSAQIRKQMAGILSKDNLYLIRLQTKTKIDSLVQLEG